MDVRHLLIAGVPCAGKSQFCRWLQEHHGFQHIDTDGTPNPIDALGLRSAWDAGFSGNAEGFVAAVRDLRRPIAFDWGYPPRCHAVVERLKAAGMELWWLLAACALAVDKAAASVAVLGADDVMLGAQSAP